MTSNQTLNVIHARAAGLDVHKTQITATVLMALPGSKPRSTTRTFSALPSGLRALVGCRTGGDGRRPGSDRHLLGGAL